MVISGMQKRVDTHTHNFLSVFEFENLKPEDNRGLTWLLVTKAYNDQEEIHEKRKKSPVYAHMMDRILSCYW